MSVPYKLHKGDCRDFVSSLQFDVIITDPPYPDYNDEHGKNWEYVPIEQVLNSNVRQLVFWSADRDFPMDWTARHIWHKPNGQSNLHYEFIYERNGSKVHRVFRVPIINYQTLPEWQPHPSQKPLKLMRQLVELITKPNEIVLDPFMGSGSTGEACMQTGRRFIGIEKKSEYFAIAESRVKNSQLPLGLGSGNEAQQSVQRTGGESAANLSLFPAEGNPPAKVTAKSTRR